MHPLAIFLIAGPVIGLIFAVSLVLNVLLAWKAGWRTGRTLALVWALWMVAAAALEFALADGMPFDFDTYVLALIIAAIGYLPATPGIWLGARLRRRRAAARRV
jgi:hypothetical protein